MTTRIRYYAKYILIKNAGAKVRISSLTITQSAPPPTTTRYSTKKNTTRHLPFIKKMRTFAPL